MAYLHILCARYGVIGPSGVEMESFHPSEQVPNAVEVLTRAKILALFPELAAHRGAMPVTRYDTKAHDPDLLAKAA